MYFAIAMPVLTADTTKIWTADDYQLLSDDIRYEIINGNLFMTPAPTSFHQIVCENIGFLLSSFVRKYKIGKVLYGPIDVYFGKKNVFQPDVLFVGKENNGIVVPKGIIGAPDLVVEVLSPSNSFSDLYSKKEVYEDFGVKEYWIADPGNRTLDIFYLDSNGKFAQHIFASEDGQITSKLLNGLVFDLSIVWQM